MPKRRLVGSLVGTLVLLVCAGAAWGRLGPGPVEVEMTDTCEPVSFNAAIGPGTCVGNGTTTFAQFINQLVTTRDAPEWRNIPLNLGVRAGRGLHVTNTGGEFHTYTEVAAFGGGCVPVLNQLLGGLTPVPECDNPELFDTTGAPPGGTVDIPGMAGGTHLFMCLIHPWMKATVNVRPG